MAYATQCFCGGCLCLFAAGTENLVDLRQTCFPVLATLPNGAKLCLHHIVQELLDLHVTQSATLIVGLQFVQTAVLRQELLKILRLAESVQIDKDRIALHLAGVFYPQMVGGR